MQPSKPVALTTLATAALALASILFAPAASARVFASYPDTDGAYPEQNLVLSHYGYLSGTAPYGGKYGYGDLFQLDPQNGSLTILHSFTDRNGDGADSSGPVVKDSFGNIYGVTNFGGGAASAGALYSFDPTTRQITLVQSFGTSL